MRGVVRSDCETNQTGNTLQKIRKKETKKKMESATKMASKQKKKS